MFNIQQTLLEIVGALQYSEFKKACEDAGIDDARKEFVLDLINEMTPQ